MKFLRHALIDMGVVLGTIVLAIGGVALFFWVLTLLRVPSASSQIVEGIGIILLMLLLATPYWIYRFFKRNKQAEMELEFPTIRKFALILTIVCVFIGFLIDLFVQGDAPLPAIILTLGTFAAPLLWLYRRRSQE